MNETPEYRLKVQRAGLGLKSFVASLAAGITAMACQAPLAAAEYFIGTTSPLASMILGWITALSIIAAGISFGILLSGLFMAPRNVDIRPDLEQIIPGLVRIIAGAMSVFACLVLCTVILIMSVAYMRTHNFLIGAITLFSTASLLFCLSVGYALVKTMGALTEHQTLRERIAVIIIRSKSDAGYFDRFMGKLEWVLTSMISVALYLMFNGEKLVSILQMFTGNQQAESSAGSWSSSDAVFQGISFIIILFAAAFTVKSLRTIIEAKRIR